MLISEFESITGIYPDTELYEAIERAYMDGDWQSKQHFCDAYKRNEDGLAQRIQSDVNEKRWRTNESNLEFVAKLNVRIKELEEAEQHTINLSTMPKRELVKYALAGVDDALKMCCAGVAEGHISEYKLNRITELTAQHNELTHLLEELSKCT